MTSNRQIELVARDSAGRVRRPKRSTLRGARWDDLRWLGLVTAPALVVAGALIASPRAAIALVIIVLVVGLHQHERRLGIYALFAFWCLVPELRRVLDQLEGYAGTDPLSVAPFVATAILAAIELHQSRLPTQIRRVMLLAGAGFAFGLPVGMLHPKSGVYALTAYLCGVAAIVLGANDAPRHGDSAFRRVLIFLVPALAVYGIVGQRLLHLPSWEQAWLGDVSFNSIGADSTGHVRLFSTLNAPGTLAPLLGLSLLAYLTVRARGSSGRNLALLSVIVIAAALELTFVRSAWLALVVAALAHVLASRGRSARLVFGTLIVVAALTLALSPISSTARGVVTRAETFAHLSSDVSANSRSSTLTTSFPSAIRAPLGHGLGSAGQPSQLNTAQADLAVPDDGYLSLIYQVGPVGFLLVVSAIGLMLRCAWVAARSPGPEREAGALLFALLVFMAVVLGSGDAFYGLGGLTLWYAGGQALRLGTLGGSGQPHPAWRRTVDREAPRRPSASPVDAVDG